MKSVAIVQSNYFPWRGYFDLIASVDEFILFDDVQYTKRNWRNRNLIMTEKGPRWLTIPVEVKGRFMQSIRETKIADENWGHRHWNVIKSHYKKAPYFSYYKDFFEQLLLRKSSSFLSQVNHETLKELLGLLNIPTVLKSSMEYGFERSNKTEQLVKLCKKANADIYVSGLSAKGYLDLGLFRNEGIRVSFFDYSDYRPYPQLNSNYVERLSIIDLIFNTGPNAKKFMKSESEFSLEQAVVFL